MKLKHSQLVIELAAFTLLAVSASAHEPAAQTQETKGHDMSKMQGHDMKGHNAGSIELHKAMMSGMPFSRLSQTILDSRAARLNPLIRTAHR